MSLSQPFPKPSNEALTCSSMAELKQIHSQTIRLGLSGDNYSVGKLIKFCSVSDSGDFDYALKLFDQLPQPDAFVYNTMMKGQSLSLFPKNSLHFYTLMLTRFTDPNRFTFPSLIQTCSRVGTRVDPGREVHAHVYKFGFKDDPFCQNGLIHMYFTFGSAEDARRVFDNMPQRDTVSSTSMISGYSRLGLVDEALEIFESGPNSSPATWNAVIASLVRSGRTGEAFALFRRMRGEGVALDQYLAATMLAACADLGAVAHGRWVHGYVAEFGWLERDPKLVATLIDMYSKCGSVDEALSVFDSLPRAGSGGARGVSPWNSMIGGLAVHGRGRSAIEIFDRMVREGTKPDKITFVNVLSACAHSGLVEEGRAIFQSMSEVHGIEPGPEHFGCLVDLLGRAGLLKEAEKVAARSPAGPDVGVLGALLGACRIHGDVELGERVGKKVIELDPRNSGRYVLLANLYADTGRFEDVARIRKLMSDRGVKKVAGQSAVEFGGVVSEFVAGDRTHPRSQEIYAKLNEIITRIDAIGYVKVPEYNGDNNDDESRDSSYYHSERLAIAYGLLMTKPGDTIRVSKNLRVCQDCHVATKLISAAYDREIVVRDRNRFHHFKMGECSCKDYW